MKKKKTSKPMTWTRFKRFIPLYLMVLAPIITVFIFHYIPLAGVVMAFKNYRPSIGIWGSEWVGLKHFKAFIEYPYFWRIMRNTLVLSLFSFITFPMPILFALILNELRSKKLCKTAQMVTYAPHFISVVVVCSMLRLFIKEDGGLLNIIIEALGGTQKDFIAESSAFPWIYTISGLWQGLGWSTIIYTSALAGVSMDQIEAAKMDGANRLQVIWHVNLPHLKPTIILLLIMKMGSLFSIGFEKVFLLQNPLNLDVSTTLSTYAYNIGLVGNQYSYSTAVGLFDNYTGSKVKDFF